jgi:hypothetical protein
MKKSISLTLAMLMTMSFFVGCEEEAPEAHEHDYATEWSSDATKHWHAATCDDEDDCETAIKDVDGHVDANKDGACDVCAYVVCAHEFATEWSYDATNHWYAATCGCNVKKDEAAHTANAAGVACSVCGAAMTPDVSDVAKAIAVGVAQGDEVAYGAITYVMDSEYYDAPVRTEISYEVAENYAHVKSVTAQYSSWAEEYQVSVEDGYFTAFGEENVFAIEKGEDGEYVLINEEFTQEVTEGYRFGDFLGYGETEVFYGVENLVSSLYALGADFANNEMTASVEDGVYSFAFEFVDEYDYIYDVEVAFTLGESYNFENVAVKSGKYLAETTGEGENLVYSIPADTDPSFTYTYEITQICGENIVPAPFDVEEVLITDITFKEVTDNTVNLTTGSMKKIYVNEIQPATAVFELNAHEITVVDAEGNETYSAQAGFSGDSDGIYMYVTAYAAGEYTLKLANAVTEVELSLVATNPEVSAVWAEIGGTATTEATVYTGATVEMEVYATQYANQGYTATVEAPTGNSVTLTTEGQYVSFTPDVVGEYVVTIKSAENETITTTVTITAKEAPQVTDILNGTWSGNDVNGRPASVVFTPDATPATGYVTSGSAVVSYQKYDHAIFDFKTITYNVTYTYSVSAGLDVTITDSSEHNYNLALTSNFTIALNSPYGYEMAALTQENAGGSTATALDLTGMELYDAINNLYIVFDNATKGHVADSLEMGSETVVWTFDYSATSEEITFSNWTEVSETNYMPVFTGYAIYMDGENVAAVELSYTHPMNGMSVRYTFEVMV